MFGRLNSFTAKGLSLKPDPLFFQVFQQSSVLFLVTDLNTLNQLFQGKDAKGQSLDSIGGSYTPFTVALKQKKGQPFDRVTLRDTGDFYKTFTASATPTEIRITANTLVHGTDLELRWGEDLIGLTKESRKELVEVIIPLMIKELRTYLLS